MPKVYEGKFDASGLKVAIVVSRLTWQKGIDLLIEPANPYLPEEGLAYFSPTTPFFFILKLSLYVTIFSSLFKLLAIDSIRFMITGLFYLLFNTDDLLGHINIGNMNP